MISKFVVRSRSKMNEEVEKATQPYVIITIADFNEDHLMFKDNPLNKGVLYLNFRDSDNLSIAKHKGYEHEMFTSSHAREILNFLQVCDGVSRDDVNVVYVNCIMGRCRSAAVAASLSKILFNDDTEFFGTYKYNPNMFVYRTLINEYYGASF